MSQPGPETKRGKDWAKLMRSRGWWVEKMPASTLKAGVPDWVQGRSDCGVIFTEAKTLEAVREAKTPREACTRAQQYFLDQVVRCNGYATILILGEDCWVEHDWRDVDELGEDGDWWELCDLQEYTDE